MLSMNISMQQIYLLIPLLPLMGAAIVGLGNRALPRSLAHIVTILGVAGAFALSVVLFLDVLKGHTFNGSVYTWLESGNAHFEVGFLVDKLTAVMMLVVTFVSLMVHIYTIGYMHEDDGYRRFFSYISLFTFSMLMLVMSNNFMQLFFGWEAVGLVSYLLIGFWFTRPTAIYANLKAFLVNRVGDFGFLLGIGMVLYFFGSLDYKTVFEVAPDYANDMVSIWPGQNWSLLTVICLLLFVGAMGKSAQVPLHVWLPDSMEGPTPISALIHAATMVTAGIFMVARMSPLYELSTTALSTVMVIGAITALFMGFLGIIQNDIKRVVAYSTLSQLGYMTVALGASAYSVAIFHLMTHAFFKALLFLGAGSVIMGMHHDQDIRNMGGLRKYMKITWLTSLVGSLALIGTPFLSGFYSKDSIIEAAKLSHIPGSTFAYYAVLAGVFVTAFYSFRMYFLVFHGKERFDQNPDAHHDDHHGAHDDHGHHDAHHPHESPWVVWVPLVLLAIPSVVIGFLTIEPMLFGEFFKGAIFIDHEKHPGMEELTHLFHGPVQMALHAVSTLPFWLALGGVATSYYMYMINPALPAAIKRSVMPVFNLLENKYYLDWINENILARGARAFGTLFWKVGDQAIIDGAVVNGSWKLVGKLDGGVRRVQTGYLYHYALVMILGIFVLMTYFVWLK